MASLRRLEKLNALIKEELARIIDREIEFPEGMIVTITRVSVSRDSHYAAVFVSALGDGVETAVEILRQNVYNIQQNLNRKIRARPVPKIKFAPDEQEIRREAVEKSIADLKRSGEI